MIMDANKTVLVTRHITRLVDDSKDVLERGNKDGAAYLACIAGMWMNFFKLPLVNPYSDSFLHSWFTTGYDCYTQSLGINDELRKQIIEHEKKWAKEHPDGGSQKKNPVVIKHETTSSDVKVKRESIWTKKLW